MNMNDGSYIFLVNMNNCSYNIIMQEDKMMDKPNENVIKAMEELLKIAGDSTRLKIMFTLLGDGVVEKNVSEIQTETNSSQSLVSHQLKILKDADLVNTRKEGTKIYYSLKDEHVEELLKVVLEHVLEKM